MIKNDPKKFWITSSWLLPLITIAIATLSARIWKIPPKLMGDELYYNWNARLFDPSEWTLPNYLFSLTFRATSSCGLDYYYCAKGLNVGFTLGFALIIYLIARRFSSPGLSLFVALLAFLGPIGSYASYFTPDSMFYFFAGLLIFFAIGNDEDSKFWSWAFVGAVLGLTALIKPHAIFLLPSLLVYAAFVVVKSEKQKPFKVLPAFTAVVASFSVVKFGVGYLFGGIKGLTLLGSSYDASLNTVLTNTSENEGGKILGSNFGQALMDFGTQTLLHGVFLMVFFSIPGIALLALALSALKQRNKLGPSERFVLFTALALVSLLLVVSLFSSVSSAWGEFGLRTRLIIRYYEYVLPFVPLVSLVYLSVKQQNMRAKNRWIIAGVISLVTIWGAIQTQSTIPAQFADSSLLGSIFLGGLPYAFFAVLTAGILLYWAKEPNKGHKLWLFGYYPFVILYFVIASYVNFTVPANNGIYEEVAMYTSENLSQSERDRVFILGNDKFLIQTTQFWLDTNKSRGAMVPEGSSVYTDRLPSDVEYVLLVGNVQLVGDAIVLKQEPNWMVVKLQAGLE